MASGKAQPVAEEKTESVKFYKASGLRRVARAEDVVPLPPPRPGVPPDLTVSRARGHRWLDARTYQAKRSTRTVLYSLPNNMNTQIGQNQQLPQRLAEAEVRWPRSEPGAPSSTGSWSCFARAGPTWMRSCGGISSAAGSRRGWPAGRVLIDQIPLENGCLLVCAEASSWVAHGILLVQGLILTRTTGSFHFRLVQNIGLLHGDDGAAGRRGPGSRPVVSLQARTRFPAIRFALRVPIDPGVLPGYTAIKRVSRASRNAYSPSAVKRAFAGSFFQLCFLTNSSGVNVKR